MTIKSSITALIFMLMMSSCATKVYQDISFENVYQLSKEKNKKLWVMIGGGKDCRSCNDMFDKLSEKKVFDKYSKDYLFYKCNVMDTLNIFLHYILLTEQIPNSYIFNEKGKLVYASYNYESVNKIEESLKFCNKGREYHCEQTPFQNLKSEELLKMHNYTLQAYFNYKNEKEALSYIDSSINIAPYFYNLYLKSKILSSRGEVALSEQYEKECLLYYKQDYQAILYKDLYDPLNTKHNPVNDTINAPVISFDNEAMNLGVVKRGDDIKFSYKFRNTGKKPLVLFTVRPDCSCVNVKFSRKPIMPNEESNIEVVLKEDRKGDFSREIQLLCNAKKTYVNLKLYGKVM